MKKLVFISCFAITIMLCIVFSGIVMAYQKIFYVEVDNNETVTTTPEYITSSESSTLIHQIGLYGTNASSTNHIYIGLQRKLVLNIYQNLTYTIYSTTAYNQTMLDNLGSYNNGTFRFLFDTENYPYNGAYYGDIIHAAT